MIIQLVSRASHHLQKKRTRFYRVLFLFRGLCAAMPCRLRREPLRAGAAFMRVNSLTSLLRKHCLLRPFISTTDKKDEPDFIGFFFCFIAGTGCDCRKREREGKTLKRCCPFGENNRNSSLLFLFVTFCHAICSRIFSYSVCLV